MVFLFKTSIEIKIADEMNIKDIKSISVKYEIKITPTDKTIPAIFCG